MSDRINNSARIVATDGHATALSRSMWRPKRTFLVVGGAGVYKSTLILALSNGSVERRNLLAPGVVSDGMGGCTSEIAFHSSDDYEFIDSPGLDDNRLSADQVYESLIQLAGTCSSGVNGVIFVVRRGVRLASETRAVIKLVAEQLFKQEQLQCLVVVTDDPDRTGVQWFNEQMSQDDTARLIGSLAEGRVVSGTLESSKSPDKDNMLLPERERLLAEMSSVLSSERFSQRQTISFDPHDKNQLSHFLLMAGQILQLALPIIASIVSAVGGR